MRAQRPKVGRVHQFDRKQYVYFRFELGQWLLLNHIILQVCALSVKQARAAAK